MELKLEVFIILVFLLISIILVSFENLKSKPIHYFIYYLAVFSLLSFFILFLIQRNDKSIEKYSNNIFYSHQNLLYSSNNYYNKPNCAIDKTCIINPDKNNLFPKDLMKLANTSSGEYSYQFPQSINKPKCISKTPCKNVNRGCNNQNMLPTITPNLDKNTLTKGQCAICKIPPYQPVEYFTNLHQAPCCKQGVNDKCQPICRGCKTGGCSQGWCFGRQCPVKKRCLVNKL